MKNGFVSIGTWFIDRGDKEEEFLLRLEDEGKIYDIASFACDETDNVEDNSEFIATACNSHYDLLEALKYLLSSYKADFKQITGAELNNTDAVRKAKAAIEKATKQPV